MSAVNCPFDGDFCRSKQLRFDAWQRAISQNNGIPFQINPDMFENCPIESEEERKKICERYQRYLFVLGNTQKQHEQR